LQILFTDHLALLSQIVTLEAKKHIIKILAEYIIEEYKIEIFFKKKYLQSIEQTYKISENSLFILRRN